MTIDVGATERMALPFEANYTYNVSPMFYAALGEHGIRGLDGKSGKECAPLLDASIAYFSSHETELQAMNPANGWGDYDGAFNLLLKLRKWCDRAPNALMEVT
jgi:hypothetical protein